LVAVDGANMKVKVHYLSLVKSFTKTSLDEFALKETSSLLDLLCGVAEKYGKPFTNEVYDPAQKEMKPTFVTMVNGVLMDQLQGINTPLRDGDNVIIMSLMTGG
jgi:molybdopterin converting factor small subunit